MPLYCSAFNMLPESFLGLTIVVVYVYAFMDNYDLSSTFLVLLLQWQATLGVRECLMWGFLWLIGAFMTLLVPLVSEGFLEEGG